MKKYHKMFGRTAIVAVMIVLLAISQGAAADHPSAQEPVSEPVIVTVDNYVKAETARQFDHYLEFSGGVNQWFHMRQSAGVDERGTPRFNRDTLFSLAVVDISQGATLTMPDAGTRYLSTMIVNEDMYINKVFHGGGTYPLNMAEFDTQYVMVLVRTLIDRSDPADIALANILQDGMKIEASSAEPYHHPVYDQQSYQSVNKAFVELGRHMPDTKDAFGRKGEVKELRHAIIAAVGWGGMPASAVYYLNVEPNLPVGEYQLTVKDVPVDAYWSLSVYDRDGFIEENRFDAYSVTNIFGTPNSDGSFTVHFGGCDDQRLNCLPIIDGWNYIVRLAQPRQEILDGRWLFPEVQPVH